MDEVTAEDQRPIIVAVIAGVGFFYGYNSLNSKEEDVFQAWADVESTLQRRADLIPNLVESVKGRINYRTCLSKIPLVHMKFIIE